MTTFADKDWLLANSDSTRSIFFDSRGALATTEYIQKVENFPNPLNALDTVIPIAANTCRIGVISL